MGLSYAHELYFLSLSSCYNKGMKKIVLLVCMFVLAFCQVGVVGAISKAQENAIKTHCEEIRGDLGSVQKTDARTRVYLGGYYETILSKFIMPLNVRLVENNLSNAGFVENQNKYAEARNLFMNDFVSYQQGLEELIAIDCENHPSEFYEKLDTVRQQRKIVEQDTLKIRNLISEHIKLVNQLKGKL